jgi:hypothetical protein
MLGLVAVAIRDSGVGVNESELERIFEHFVSTKPQGLGMGLAISRSIVEAHGGRIWATGNDARGLTLHVELPWGKRLLSTNVVGHLEHLQHFSGCAWVASPAAICPMRNMSRSKIPTDMEKLDRFRRRAPT